ncbi:MAG: ergothioneine biosynthesis protein EgtB [Acidobacteria bacterium]|nr:MAG: ergothioneine biosynthesis protein EgtB [Acidobacteriota bacterium]
MQASHPQKSHERDIKEYFSSVRAYTESLCKPLEIEDYIPQPIVDVSPAKWHIAHTTWFFEEMILKQFVPNYRVFDPDFAFLFNSYYNSIGERTPRAQRGAMSRPTVKRVFEYRKYIDDKMLEFLSGPSVSASVTDLVILGLNHEQQHQELLLTDLKYTFSLNPLLPVYRENFAPIEIVDSEAEGFVETEAGVYEVGYDGDGFCFDNELSRHRVFLEDNRIEKRLITNREFVEFIEDGGYRNANLWHSDGWEWVNTDSIDKPLYWIERDGEPFNYTFAGLRKLSLDAPVAHVSFYEAAAFAEWKEMRLPTEFEWEAASDKFDWGLRWEWTNSAYLPYPGCNRSPGAVGEYNGKFMINQMVLRGASVITPPGHSRNTYRNFFSPHLRWQYTGIRLAK